MIETQHCGASAPRQPGNHGDDRMRGREERGEEKKERDRETEGERERGREGERERGREKRTVKRRWVKLF